MRFGFLPYTRSWRRGAVGVHAINLSIVASRSNRTSPERLQGLSEAQRVDCKDECVTVVCKECAPQAVLTLTWRQYVKLLLSSGTTEEPEGF